MATATDNSAHLACELECMEEMDEDADLLWSENGDAWSDNRESARLASRCSSSSGCFSSYHSPDCELPPRRADQDLVIANDSRVLSNLLQTEDKAVTSHLLWQEDIKPYMRKMVANWMLDVCTEQDRDEGVFLLSISLLDRFLSCTSIKRTHLQLVAAVCLFIASKSREAFHLTPDKLVAYTDFSISKLDILEWEMAVLQSLEWDTCMVTSNDFIDLLLHHLPLSLPPPQRHHVIRHAQTFACLAATEHISTIYPPSVLASASLSLSICHMGACLSLDTSLSLVQEVTGIDKESIKSCREKIEKIYQCTLLSNQCDEDVTEPSSNKIAYLDVTPPPVTSLCTPTDLLEISLI